MSEQKTSFSFSKRMKLMAISAVAFCVTLACSLFEKRDGKGEVMCYKPVLPTETPEILCYDVAEPTTTATVPSATETPEPMCYIIAPITPSPETPPTRCYDVADPSPTEDVAPTPTPSTQSSAALLQQLLVEERLPNCVTREL